MDNISTLSQDGKLKFEGTNNECFFKLQKLQGQSADWAMKYEKWAITDYPLPHKLENHEISFNEDSNLFELKNTISRGIKHFNRFNQALNYHNKIK
jgi:hypothetical protein